MLCLLAIAASRRPQPAEDFRVRWPRQIYIGSSDIQYSGWVSRTYEQLDVSKEEGYKRLGRPGTLDAFLSEHTFEHIPYADGAAAFALMHRWLRTSGLVRTAVPSFSAGMETAPSAHDLALRHVAFYNETLLRAVLLRAGFARVETLEAPGIEADCQGMRKLGSTCCKTRFGLEQFLLGPVMRSAAFTRKGRMDAVSAQLPAAFFSPRPSSAEKAAFSHYRHGRISKQRLGAQFPRAVYLYPLWSNSCSLIVDAIK